MKTRVAILRGGPSSEHEVSLKTGSSVFGALNPEKYIATDILISKKGIWYNNGYELNPRTVVESSDVIFNALHGSYGEDGGVQRELDRYGIPYTGSGAFGSATAMNKFQTKERLKDMGISMAPHVRVQHNSSNDYNLIAESIVNKLGLHCVAKPTSGGSSVNTLVTNDLPSLVVALQKIVPEEQDILVEKRISGVEATCGVIEKFRNQELYTLPVVEIVPPQTNTFFDYDAKYSGESEEVCPGRFSLKVKKQLEEAASLIHKEIELSQYSRSDFIVTPDEIFFLEVNTLPGLTQQSLLPLALSSVGIEYKEFIEHLLIEALQRKRVK